MNIDCIELTKEFEEVLAKVQPELDEFEKELDENGMGLGRCHLYWQRKKELLKSHGIDWKTPPECNPDVRFD